MFQNPFSFNGRIRRMEYGISLVIYFVVIIILEFIIGSDESMGWIGLALLPVLWFMLAQGAKRCHDRGNSGWYQIIPFYGLWMLFADSMPGPNEYGLNPKGVGNFAMEIEEIGSDSV